MFELVHEVNLAADYLKQRWPHPPSLGLILGSGLNPFAETLGDKIKIAFREIPGFAPSTVEGHAGNVVMGKLAGLRIMALQGRFHFYEGHSLARTTLPVRLMAALGVKLLLLTNAAGGVNRNFKPGDLMLIRDHINFFGTNPLIGPNHDAWGPRFPDLSQVYDRELATLVRRVAQQIKLELREGVYLGSPGPSYETPSEVRMMGLFGADAVGMSTVPEAIVSRHMGLRVIGISCITNMACGILDQPLNHQEVIATTTRVKTDFERLLTGIISEIAARNLA